MLHPMLFQDCRGTKRNAIYLVKVEGRASEKMVCKMQATQESYNGLKYTVCE